MNIRNIKDRADALLTPCRPQVIRLCIIMGLVQLVPVVFEGNNIVAKLISFVLMIVFVPFTHGYIVTALKVVRNNSQALSDEDAFVGFNRFKELFPTYFLVGFIEMLISLAFAFVLFFCFGALLSTVPFDIIKPEMLSDPAQAMAYLFKTFPSLIAIIFVLCTVIVIFMIFMNAYFFAVPYLLEKYEMKTMTAIKESFSFIKGNVFTYLKLEFSFWGWILLVAFGQGLLAQALSFLPLTIGSMIASIVGVIVAAYLYYPKYITSEAIFFEEIAYYRYLQGEMNHE